MKSLAAAIALFYFASTMAAAPYGIKGQQQAATLYSNVHQFPNNLVTNTGGINALVENGNNNILSNPSFEHLITSSSWVDNGVETGIETAVAVVNGKKALAYLPTAETINLTQSSTLYAAQFADGVQGLAMVRIKSDVALKVCSIQADTVSSTNCVTTNTDSKWGLYKVPFILGATSNGISISSNGTLVTGTVYIDDAFVGAQDLTQNITACQTADCETEFSINVSATGVVTEETGGDWISSCTNATTPVCTFNTGIFTVAPHCWSVPGIAGFTGYENIVSSTQVSIYTISNSAVAVAGARKYFCKKQGADYVAAINRSNGNTYSSNNADTDWASCGHTTSDFTNLGTVNTIETQCKRQGGDLLMKGNFTVVTGSAAEARLSLKFNGVALTSKNTSVIPSIQKTSDLAISGFASSYFNSAVLMEPSVGYVTFGTQSSASAEFTKINGSSLNGTKNGIVQARVPIAGWENSNIIIGSFNGLQSCTDTLACTDTFSAAVSSAGVVSKENANWLNGNCSVSATSTYTCNFNSSIFTVAPNCVFISNSGSNINLFQNIATTASSVQPRSQNNSNVDIAQGFDIICQKQGADYIGKTAMAVASDQNLRTPGVTNSVVYSAFIGAAGTVVSEVGNLINGNCTVASTNVFTCTFTSEIFASDPVCNLTVMGASGASRSAYIVTSPTTSGLTYLTYNTSGPTATALNVQLTCHGVSP